MKKILFPFNPKDDNESAFVYALELGKKLNAQIIMLSAVQQAEVDNKKKSKKKQKQLVPTPEFDKKQWYEIFWHVIEMKKKYIASQTPGEKMIKHVRFRYEFHSGSIIDQFKKYIRVEHPNFIVSPYVRPGNDSLFGKNMVKTFINEVKCPLLLVPPGATPYRGIQNVAYTTDFKMVKNSRMILKDAVGFAELFSAKMHFLHIMKKGNKDKAIKDSSLLKTMLDKSKKNGRFTLDMVEGKNIFQVVKEYIKGEQIDLLMAVKHQKNLVEEIFDESFTEQVSFYSKTPLLVYHE